MRSDNVCLFMPYIEGDSTLRVLNFVLESDPAVYGSMRRESVYKINVVIDGKATVFVDGNGVEVGRGDVFVTLPSFCVKIDGDEGFKFAYASFVGRKGTMLVDKMKITRKNYAFKGNDALIARWTDCFGFNGDAVELVVESAVLYTAAMVIGEGKHVDSVNLSPLIKKCKKFADDNFCDSALTLNSVATSLFYNPKYVSYAFKKEVGVGFNDYLKTIRVEHAITLFNSGIIGIKEVAFNCGFADAQYFSKAFKQKTGYSPSEYKREFLGLT